MKEERNFLGLVYIVRSLLEKGILQYDPCNHDNMIVYYDPEQRNGWYSANILSRVSEIYHNKEQLEYVLSVATANNIDIEKYFADAKKLIKDPALRQSMMTSNTENTEKHANKLFKTNRPSKKEYYLEIAKAVSKRSTCLKRHYGAVIVKDDEIIATGYNGAPRGMENCCDRGFCPRMGVAHNSGDYTDCPAVHAEQNAIISASRRDLIGATLYLCGEEIDTDTHEVVTIRKGIPCPICERIIRNSGIAKVVSYDHEMNLSYKEET